MTADDVRPVLTRRMRGIDLIALDLLPALGLLLVVGYAAAEPPIASEAPDLVIQEPAWLTVLFTVAASLPIAVRRWWPLPVLAVVSVGALSSVLVSVVPIYASPAVFLAIAFALYQVALAEPLRRSIPALLLVLVGVLLVAVPRSSAGADDTAGLGFAGLVVGGAWTLGRVVRERRAYAERMAVQSATQLAERATTEERLRLARELHDIVAHSMSVITVKAAIANHVAESRPQELREALRDIEATSRGALAELRRTLGVLRAGAPAGLVEFGPAPGLADLPDLVERAARAGADAELELDLAGTPEPPEDVGRSVYRIVQEALTNVVKHAGPSRCRVRVTATVAVVRVEVTNGPGRPVRPADPRGQGLIGMRERVNLYGGTFAAGPLPDGGFRICAELPGRPTDAPVPRTVDPAVGSAPLGDLTPATGPSSRIDRPAPAADPPAAADSASAADPASAVARSAAGEALGADR
ncbi:sensor histidine kinase [Plantactinospora soyae]|uniref:histidine kinase n=1 Tax=Plantactinospora soyae TaxID=1544732 RepID=A0A927M6U6_9ACTN|nr:sensor histidine kinase [Plantactinospora soyae]MBE1489082.1 signal transduction histidine kinase [Plantactinospora soyae]